MNVTVNWPVKAEFCWRRLGTYRYYDMHQVVAQAMSRAKKELQHSGMPLTEAA